ncbi:MAG: hypothetical protein Q9M20_03305 [Mariprofundaceae bacterium]|nr:hypothetical protein [Mariprofundaceae bacterium]
MKETYYITRYSATGIQQGHALRSIAPMGVKRLVMKPEEEILGE